MNTLNGVVERIGVMLPILNEKQKRLMLAVEAKTLGFGGIKIVSEISGISRITIMTGIKELSNSPTYPNNKTRKKGGGRKKKEVRCPELKQKILDLVESATRGDPESALRWCS